MPLKIKAEGMGWEDAVDWTIGRKLDGIYFDAKVGLDPAISIIATKDEKQLILDCIHAFSIPGATFVGTKPLPKGREFNFFTDGRIPQPSDASFPPACADLFRVLQLFLEKCGQMTSSEQATVADALHYMFTRR